MLNINAERCFATDVIFMDIGTMNTTNEDIDYATLIVVSAHLPGRDISVARGTLQEMIDLRKKIIPYMGRRMRTGYFDIPTESWIEHKD